MHGILKIDLKYYGMKWISSPIFHESRFELVFCEVGEYFHGFAKNPMILQKNDYIIFFVSSNSLIATIVILLLTNTNIFTELKASFLSD